MNIAVRSVGRLAAAAALVAVAVVAVGISARPADAQGAPSVSAGGPYTGAVNIPITFTATASTGVPIISYAWNFGDGTTANGSIAQKSYTTAGTFTVTVTATANNGLSASATTTASVGVAPVGAVYPGVSPYGVGSVVNPYLNTGVYNPYLNTGVYSPYLNTGLYNPYLTSGYPCGVPVTIGGSTVTSACSGPFVNTGYPYIGTYPYGGTYPSIVGSCIYQPITRFGASLRRFC